MGVDDALRDACPIRMRPVVMTSLTIILALLPAAIGLGAGAETNAPLSLAVIGGMITSTLLTLVVVPAGYSLVENWRERRRAAAAPRGAAALQAPQLAARGKLKVPNPKRAASPCSATSRTSRSACARRSTTQFDIEKVLERLLPRARSW